MRLRVLKNFNRDLKYDQNAGFQPQLVHYWTKIFRQVEHFSKTEIFGWTNVFLPLSCYKAPIPAPSSWGRLPRGRGIGMTEYQFTAYVPLCRRRRITVGSPPSVRPSVAVLYRKKRSRSAPTIFPI